MGVACYGLSTVGPYLEHYSGIQVRDPGGQTGYYIPYIYVTTNDAALASGVLGAPKQAGAHQARPCFSTSRPAICSGECPVARLLPTHLRRSDWRASLKRQIARPKLVSPVAARSTCAGVVIGHRLVDFRLAVPPLKGRAFASSE
ncbi:acetoacetate decarboxylase family protein [Bradyrhizobium sp. IC3195]|uniref:acetoacetate decarboxylase family protein n=1 Tax=Bradyrhizobium sp. IC3195 TaxID=2793804 RepID=UPI00321195C6